MNKLAQSLILEADKFYTRQELIERGMTIIELMRMKNLQGFIKTDSKELFTKKDLLNLNEIQCDLKKFDSCKLVKKYFSILVMSDLERTAVIYLLLGFLETDDFVFDENNNKVIFEMVENPEEKLFGLLKSLDPKVVTRRVGGKEKNLNKICDNFKNCVLSMKGDIEDVTTDGLPISDALSKNSFILQEVYAKFQNKSFKYYDQNAIYRMIETISNTFKLDKLMKLKDEDAVKPLILDIKKSGNNDLYYDRVKTALRGEGANNDFIVSVYHLVGVKRIERLLPFIEDITDLSNVKSATEKGNRKDFEKFKKSMIDGNGLDFLKEYVNAFFKLTREGADVHVYNGKKYTREQTLDLLILFIYQASLKDPSASYDKILYIIIKNLAIRKFIQETKPALLKNILKKMSEQLVELNYIFNKDEFSILFAYISHIIQFKVESNYIKQIFDRLLKNIVTEEPTKTVLKDDNIKNRTALAKAIENCQDGYLLSLFDKGPSDRSKYESIKINLGVFMTRFKTVNKELEKIHEIMDKDVMVDLREIVNLNPEIKNIVQGL